MATLAEATSKSVEDLGYTRITPSEQAPQRPNIPETSSTMFMRTPLPPTTSTPDSIKQFQVPGIPQTRIIPPVPPTNTNTGASSGGTTVVEGSGSSGGSSGGGSAPVPTLQNASVTTPTLSQNQSSQISVPLATVFALVGVSTNGPARIRLYSTKSAQTSDLGRAATTPVVIGTENGIIADFLLLGNTELTWTCSPIVMGFNGDNPTVSTCYVTITNPNPTSSTFTVSFTYAVLIP